MSSSTSSSVPPPTVCHSLPCHIEYSGKAPVDVYFHPTPVPHSNLHNDDTTTKEGTSEEDTSSPSHTIYAATLRGRGLLARVPNHGKTVEGTNEEQPTAATATAMTNAASAGATQPPSTTTTTTTTTKHVQGRLLETNDLTTVAHFDELWEWHHAHSPDGVVATKSNNNDGTERLPVALEWMAVAEAMHAPLPLPTNTEASSTTSSK